MSTLRRAPASPSSAGGAAARGLRALAGLLIAAALPVACARPFECEHELVSAGDPEVDADAFAGSLIDALEAAAPKGAGFAFSDRGGALVGRGGCGMSRDEPLDRRAFTSTTFNNWGSVSKMVTAAATLRAIAETPGASLDDPFADYIPAKWRAALHPGYAAVTIRMLLQHKGGFGRDGEIYALDDAGAVVDLLGVRLSRPVEGTVGVRSYSNISPILEHFIVAYMTDPAGMAAAEAALAATAEGDDFSRDINLAAAETYVAFVGDRLLAPAGAVASCNITDFRDHALSYPSGESRGGGVYTREAFAGDHTDECSAGGWIIDPEGLLALLAALRHGEEILPAALYGLMENAAVVDDRLGYASARTTADGVAFCHGGSYHNNHAAVCSFANGMQAVVNVNSALPGGSSGLQDALVAAYDAALRP